MNKQIQSNMLQEMISAVKKNKVGWGSQDAGVAMWEVIFNKVLSKGIPVQGLYDLRGMYCEEWSPMKMGS